MEHVSDNVTATDQCKYSGIIYTYLATKDKSVIITFSMIVH